VKRLRAVPVADVCISVITKSELLYSVEVSPRRTQDATALQAFLPHVEVLEFPDNAATHYAQIRAELPPRQPPASPRRSEPGSPQLGTTVVAESVTPSPFNSPQSVDIPT
jgi:hypothetical protein